MKLKYYLRGLGMGMLFTAFMFVILIIPNKSKMTDEEVIAAAKALGMVEKQDEESGMDLSGIISEETRKSDENNSTENLTEGANPTESPKPTEVTQPTEQANPTESPKPTEVTQPTEQANPTEEAGQTEGTKSTENLKATEGARPTENSKPTEGAKPTENPKPTENSKPTEGAKPTENSKPTENPKPTEEAKVSVSAGTEAEEGITIVVEKGMSSEMLSEELYNKGLIDDVKEFNKFLISNGHADSLSIGNYKIAKGSTYGEIAGIITRR